MGRPSGHPLLLSLTRIGASVSEPHTCGFNAMCDGYQDNYYNQWGEPAGRVRSKLTLIKAQFFTLNTAAERGTSDETEATRHHAHNQRRRIQTDNCGLDRTVFSDNFRWEETPAHHAASLTLALQCLILRRLAISISMSHLGFHMRCTRIAHAAGNPQAHQLGQRYSGRGERQRIRAISRDRLSSETSEEMEARLMSRAAREYMLIARKCNKPAACA